MAQGLFKVGPVAGQSPHTSGFAKIPSAPSAFPLLGAPQVQGNKPSEEGKAWGNGPLRPKELSSAEPHPAEPRGVMTAY